MSRIAAATRGSRSREPAERDERLRVARRAGLVVDVDARDVERSREALPGADSASIRSSAGMAPPAVKTGPSITQRSGRTSASGKRAANSSRSSQCVVAAPPVEQAGEPEHPGAGLDAAGHRRALRAPVRTARSSAFGRVLDDVEGGEHDQHVAPPRRLEGAVDRQRQAAARRPAACRRWRRAPSGRSARPGDPVRGAHRVEGRRQRHQRRIGIDEERDRRAAPPKPRRSWRFALCKGGFALKSNAGAGRAVKVRGHASQSRGSPGHAAARRTARSSSPAPSPAPATPSASSDKVPVTPAQIADAAIEAAEAGAAIAHIHVRDPETGKARARSELYREVVERIRASGVDVVLNLTAGMGGDLVLGSAEAPLPPSAAGTDMAGATERLAHVARAPARDLHARLRHDELRRGRLRHDQHAGDAAGDGAADPGARRAARDRGLRHRPPGAGQVAEGAGADRRPGDDPALHGHPLGRAGRHPHASWRWSTTCPRAGPSRPSRSAGSSCRTSALAVLAGGNVRVGLEDNL